jgi:DNA-binding SARP family transcriptional activator
MPWSRSGKLDESTGNQTEALGYYLRAAHLRPEREDAAFAIMRLYQELQLPDDALKVYHRLVTTLKERLNVEPSAQVQKLAAQIGK